MKFVKFISSIIACAALSSAVSTAAQAVIDALGTCTGQADDLIPTVDQIQYYDGFLNLFGLGSYPKVTAAITGAGGLTTSIPNAAPASSTSFTHDSPDYDEEAILAAYSLFVEALRKVLAILYDKAIFFNNVPIFGVASLPNTLTALKTVVDKLGSDLDVACPDIQGYLQDQQTNIDTDLDENVTQYAPQLPTIPIP